MKSEVGAPPWHFVDRTDGYGSRRIDANGDRQLRPGDNSELADQSKRRGYLAGQRVVVQNCAKAVGRQL
ncbi:hypothetical protein [Rhodococcus erythropolis]